METIKSPLTCNSSERTAVDEKDLGVQKYDNEPCLDSGFSMISLKDTSEVLYIDEAAEKKLVMKLDLHILPLFCLFYFADFLDRANIGNAT